MGDGVVMQHNEFQARPPFSHVLIPLIAATALLLSGCSSGDDTVGASADATSAPTTAAPVTTAAPATTEADTTTEAPATSEAEDPRRVALEDGAGTYSGTWTNTTFGSSGPMEMVIAVDGEEVVFDVDLGGSVFGQGDPDPESARISIDELLAGGTIESAVFGPLSMTIDAATGTMTMTAEAVPAGGIAAFESTVTPSGADSGEGTYLVTFDDGTTAEGLVDYVRS